MKASLRHIFILIVIVGGLFFQVRDLETAIEHSSPFRHSGDGRLALIDVHTGERLSIIYRDKKGSYDDAALSAFDHLLRCHGGSEKYPMSQKLVELVDYLQDFFGAKEVLVVSGYRTPQYNENLRKTNMRVAHDSLHLRGLAMDIKIPDVGKEKLGKLARSLKSGGVGVYSSSDFVHVDSGPVRDW